MGEKRFSPARGNGGNTAAAPITRCVVGGIIIVRVAMSSALVSARLVVGLRDGSFALEARLGREG